jgi:hypothetical protein
MAAPWADYTRKDTSSVAIRAIVTHTAGPATPELSVATCWFRAQRVPLVGTRRRAVAAHDFFPGGAGSSSVAAVGNLSACVLPAAMV